MSVLIAWFIKSSVVLTAAWIVSGNRRLSAAARHLVLFTSLACIPVLFLGELLAPKPLVAIQTPQFVLEYVGEFQGDTPTNEPAYNDAAEPKHGFGAGSWPLFELLYLFITASLIIRLGARLWLASKQVRRYPIISRDPVEIRMSGRSLSPFSWCLLRACVVVPQQWLDWSADKRLSVLAHERAHIERRDGLTSVIAAIVCALCWLHPLMWLARRRCQLLAEQACDDAVVRQGIQDTTYAQHLLEISRMRATQLAPSMAQFSQLGSRIKLLLDKSVRRPPMRTGITLTLMCATFAFVTTVFAMGMAGDARTQLVDVREALVTKLATAQVHIDDERFADAHRVLDEARQMQGLNGNEQAQIENMSGYAHFRSGAYSEAIQDYEKVVQAGKIPLGLRTTTLYTLAQLHYVEAEYEQAIEYMRQWMETAEDPGPIPGVFIAQTYYQMQEFDKALKELDTALAIARGKGVTINPNWMKLYQYLVAVRDNSPGAQAPRHSGVDGEYFPIAKVAPVYPEPARQHRIEGYVVVEFSVDKDGRTQDLRVVDAQPPEIFDTAALAAVRKFKYKPRMEGGHPVAVSGVRNKIRFALDDS